MSETSEPKREGGKTTRTAQVPRRYPMGTMMLMVTLFAVLFAVLKSIDLPGWVILIIAGLFLAVGMAQMWLFRGRRPKLASMVAGGVVLPLIVGGAHLILSSPRLSRVTTHEWIAAILSVYVAIPVGAVLGYAFGCLAASVFLFWRTDCDERAAEEGGGQTDGTAAPTVPERPSWDERILWPVLWLSRTLSRDRATVAPFLAWRNVTLLLWLFVSVPVALGVLADYGPRSSLWTLGIVLGVAFVAPVIVGWLYVGLRLAGWKAAVILPILGLFGGLPMVLPARAIHWPWQEFSRNFSQTRPAGAEADGLPFLAGLTGLIVGLVVAASFGWMSHLIARWQGRVGRPRSRRSFVFAVLALAACLAACWLGVWAYSRGPYQRAVAMLTTMNATFEFDPRAGAWYVAVSGPVSENIDPSLLAGLRPIGCLVLDNVANADPWIEAVGNQNMPIDISLSGTPLGPKSVAAIARITNLNYFSVSHSDLIDVHLKSLSGMAGLRYLMIDDSAVTDEGIEHLKDLPSLQILTLNKTRVTDDGLAKLDSLPVLWILCLKETRVTGRSLGPLGKLPSLTRLLLDGNRLSSDFGRQLNALKTLGMLTLNGAELPPGCLRGLTGSVPLTHISLQHAKFDQAELAHLKALTRLTTLDLTGTDVGDEAMAELAKIPTLTELTLTGTKVGNRGIRYFEKHARLAELSLGNTRVDDKAVDSLTKMPSLIMVDTTPRVDTTPLEDTKPREVFGLEAQERLETYLQRGSSPPPGGGSLPSDASPWSEEAGQAIEVPQGL